MKIPPPRPPFAWPILKMEKASVVLNTYTFSGPNLVRISVDIPEKKFEVIPMDYNRTYSTYTDNSLICGIFEGYTWIKVVEYGGYLGHIICSPL